MNTNEHGLIDMAGAAKILDVTRQHVYYLVMDGQIEVTKIHRRNYFTRETLNNHLKKTRHGRATTKDKATATP